MAVYVAEFILNFFLFLLNLLNEVPLSASIALSVSTVQVLKCPSSA